ncbi:MAG: hypothetical protein R6T96_16225, partial [Longimicrobiales bacterium]
LREQYRLPVPTPEEARGIVVRPNPAFSPGASTYRPASFLLFYAGAAYTPRTRYVNGEHDGNGVVGAAFGNPARWLGVQADLGLYSTVRRGFFDRMGLSLEVYRYLPGEVVLSLGWENIATRGRPDTGESQYGVLSRWFRLRPSDRWFNSVGVSAGVGNGRYVKEEDWLRNNTNALNGFGSMTLQVAWPLALVADWQGDDLTLGAAFTPLKGVPLIITPAVYDVTGRVESGAQFMISAVVGVRVR